MTTRPSSELRHEVSRRAGNRCEYCLLHQDFAASTHQVDHVIAEKHRGLTSSENLALSCTICNRRKGSDIGALDPETGQLVRVFSPRTQNWQEHFELGGRDGACPSLFTASERGSGHWLLRGEGFSPRR
jgi:hypothetical protein